MCVFVRYYVKDESCMYAAYLHASKVFDRMNHTKLLSKLFKLGVPKYLIKVICQLCCDQTMYVKWGSVLSDFFSMNNG